jgi:ribonuclease PH
MCAVKGPLQMTGEHRGALGRVACTVARAPFAGKTRKEAGNDFAVSADAVTAQQLQGALERVVLLDRIPQLQYDVLIDVVSSDADAETTVACVVAASMALADAGVAMTDMLGAAHIAVTASDALVVDPTPEEQQTAVGSCFVAAGVHSGGVCLMQHRGAVSTDVLCDSIDLGVAACGAQAAGMLAAAAQRRS